MTAVVCRTPVVGGRSARETGDRLRETPTTGRGDTLLNRTRQPVGHPTARVDCDVSRLLRRGPAIRMAILAILFIHCSTAFGQTPTDGVQGVQPAGFRLGQPVLYGLLQQLPSPPLNAAVPKGWRNGVLLRVMITTEPAAQRRTGGAACRQCTAQHFFLFPSESPTGAQRKLRALRHPPGRVTYLDVKGREYALFHVRVILTEEGFRLTGATLMRTGFVPPILKKRLRLRFEAPLPAGAHKDGIIAAALAETGESIPAAR